MKCDCDWNTLPEDCPHDECLECEELKDDVEALEAKITELKEKLEIADEALETICKKSSNARIKISEGGTHGSVVNRESSKTD